MKKRVKSVEKSTPKTKSKTTISNLSKIKINFTSIEEVFNPIDCDTFLKVKAIVSGLNQYSMQESLINNRNIVTFDTGLKLDIPTGFKLNGKLLSEFSVKGLLAIDFYLDENKNLKITVLNSGPISPVVVKHMDVIAEIWFEPCYSIKLGAI